MKTEEFILAQMETRMQQFVIRLLEPTIYKTTLQGNMIRGNRQAVEMNQKDLKALTDLSGRAEQVYSRVENFREEMSKWEVQRRANEAKVAEELSLMKQDLDVFRRMLEQNKAKGEEFQRVLSRQREEVQTLGKRVDRGCEFMEAGIKEHSERSMEFRNEIGSVMEKDVRDRDEQQDELRRMRSTMAGVQGRVSEHAEALAGLSETIRAQQAGKAGARQLENLQSELSELRRDTDNSVGALTKQMDSVVNDLRSHFKTSAESMAQSNARLINNTREEYQEELRNAAQVREEVSQFVQDTQRSLHHLEGVMETSREVTKDMVNTVRTEVEVLQRGRRKDQA